MTPGERYRQVAMLHMQCLDRGFLATLGQDFLALMYEAIDQADDSLLITEECNGEIAGFITGGAGMGAIYKRMLRSPLRLGWALAPALISPAKVRRILEILRYSSNTGLPEGLPDAELLSLAVAPQWRGKSVADRLYAALVDEFSRRGVEAFRIIVGEALAPAHRFYQRMGARISSEIEVHGGEKSMVYVHRL